MRRIVWLGLFASGLVGCYMTFGDAGEGGHHHNQPFDGGSTAMPGDLPCDVANALVVCQSCHGPTPVGGAPISLVTYADLTAQSLQYPGQTEAERAVARMQGNPTPMPPAPSSPSPQTDIDALSAWIAAGYPKGTCGTQQTVCTSGLGGTLDESRTMRPGEACIACHQSSGGEAPIYQFMGTLYPTLHEPDDCVGATARRTRAPRSSSSTRTEISTR